MTLNCRMGALIALAVVALSPTRLKAEAAETFVTDAIRADVSAVKIGRLVEKKGGSAAIRAFGQTIDVDRTKTGEEAIGTAIALGVNPPAQPEPEAQAEYRRLSTMSGAVFDREFLRYIVESRQAEVRRFEAEAKAKGGDASAMAREQLPVFRRHLAIAQALQKDRDQKGPQ